LIVAFATDAPLGLVPADFRWQNDIAVVLFVGLIVLLYGWMMRRARSHSA
jgi:hypothetical protein